MEKEPYHNHTTIHTTIPYSHTKTVYTPHKCQCWGALPAEFSPPFIHHMRINLPRHDLLGEERWPISQRRRARALSSMGFYWVYLHRNTGHIHKAHQSLSGSKDQTIDNIQRTRRAYFESVRYLKGHKTLGKQTHFMLGLLSFKLRYQKSRFHRILCILS